MHTLRLTVGAMHAADIRSLVPVKAQPAQVLENADFGFLRRSLDIGIFDAEDERPVLAVRQEPVEQCRTHIAYVKVAGRTWSESNSHLQVLARSKDRALRMLPNTTAPPHARRSLLLGRRRRRLRWSSL